MAEQNDSQKKHKNVGSVSLLDFAVATVVGIGAGVGAFLTPIREELTGVLERAEGFEETVKRWRRERGLITDADGNPIHVDGKGRMVSVDSDGFILDAAGHATGERGRKVTGRILRHDAVEGGTIYDAQGRIAHVDHRNHVVAVDEHGMVLDSISGQPTGEKARKLQATSKAEEETANQFAKRLHQWWKHEDKEWRDLVFREEGVEMDKFFKGSLQAWNVIRSDKKWEIGFKAVVSTAVAGGSILMFLGSHHQRAKLSELSDKLDAMNAQQQQSR